MSAAVKEAVGLAVAAIKANDSVGFADAISDVGRLATAEFRPALREPPRYPGAGGKAADTDDGGSAESASPHPHGRGRHRGRHAKDEEGPAGDVPPHDLPEGQHLADEEEAHVQAKADARHGLRQADADDLANRLRAAASTHADQTHRSQVANPRPESALLGGTIPPAIVSAGIQWVITMLAWLANRNENRNEAARPA